MKRRTAQYFTIICMLTLSLSLSLPANAETQDSAATDTPQAKPAENLDLPGTSIIGNKELPVGLDIVPWRPAAPGSVKEGPTQLLDEPLEPIDPDVFRRRLQIYSDSKH